MKNLLKKAKLANQPVSGLPVSVGDFLHCLTYFIFNSPHSQVIDAECLREMEQA